jgi:hypothetical protein
MVSRSRETMVRRDKDGVCTEKDSLLLALAT